jgi:hypothetical protein
MTLDEWIDLTPAERNRLRFEWRDRDDRGRERSSAWDEMGQPLVDEAARRFGLEHEGHPLILYVRPAVRCDTGEPGIHVGTNLFSPQIIEELPDRYLTFAVSQQPALDGKVYYLEYWTRVLGELKGWSPEQVQSWATKWKDGLVGKDSWFFHEAPGWYLSRLLVPSAAADRLDHLRLMRLQNEIQMAIENRGHGPDVIAEGYDWEAARARVKAVLDTVGEAGE